MWLNIGLFAVAASWFFYGAARFGDAKATERLADNETAVERWLYEFSKCGCATLNSLVSSAHDNALAKGFYDSPPDFGMRLALVHSEISEVLEEYRNHQPPTLVYTDENGKPEGIPIELADAVIRILDLCGYYKIDLQAAVLRKMAYNSTRPYRHGNKAA